MVTLEMGIYQLQDHTLKGLSLYTVPKEKTEPRNLLRLSKSRKEWLKRRYHTGSQRKVGQASRQQATCSVQVLVAYKFSYNIQIQEII